MDNPIEVARNTLLEPTGLSDQKLFQLLDNLTGTQIDHADAYFQFTRFESWLLEEGRIKSGNHSIDQGVGLRAVSGEKTGVAFSDDLTLPALVQASKSARGIARGIGSSQSPKALREFGEVPALYGPDNPLQSLSDADKIALMHRVEAEARKVDSRVSEVIVSLAGKQDVVLIVRNDGHICADIRPLIRMDVTVVAEGNGRRETARTGGGSRTSYQFFFESDRALEYARDAARQAVLNLDSISAPAGNMVVVLGPGWPGILLHEAIGHGLEGDFNRKKTSAFTDRIGQQVATELCTVVDDGTLADRRGSLTIDDEGTPTECTILIEDGVLTGYMQDLTNARLMNQQPTGNGRRESYAHTPMPRMTNTYMLPGESTHEEIIESVDKGLYAVNFAGGQVDITSGKFVFSASEAYLIEKGKITNNVKGATLIGHGPEVLTKVSMVGNNLELDSGVGTCGKDGQSVPVGVGQPTIRVDGLTVGGTAYGNGSD